MTSFRIRLENVSKQFTLNRERPRSFQELFLFWRQYRQANAEKIWVLRDVSFDLAAGETVGIIGPNGAGKSTILKLIARIIQPTHGQVLVNGQLSALLELGAGFHPDLTGRENVYLNGAIRGFSRRAMRRRMDQIIDFAELESFIDTPTKHYSSGMYMRLAFSVAIHIDPEILLIDEILAVGDSAFQRKCLDRIYDMRQQDVTILMVSHNLDATIRLCNRALWLEDGVVKMDGDSRQVAEQYLQWVNQKDQARLEKQADEKAQQPDEHQPAKGQARPRSGTGEIRVTGVEFLNEQGVPAQVFRTGDPMTIRLHYRTTEPVERPVFGIGLYRDDDLHITGPNTKFGNLSIPVARGESYLDYVVDNLPLMAGHYEVTVTVYDETISHRFDGLHRAYSFSVQPRTAWDTLGVTHLPAHWSLPDGGKK